MPGPFRQFSSRFRNSVRGSRLYRLLSKDRTDGASTGRLTDDDVLVCRVLLLDGGEQTWNLPKSASGSELYHRVMTNLDLVESEYFSLQLADALHIMHWIDPLKKMADQISVGPPFTLQFRVKFYAMEPQDLNEELTRYHFFHQLKQDVLRGKIKPSETQLVELGAYAVQSELGDYDPQIHTGNYVSEFRLIPNQTPQFEFSVAQRHRVLLGMNPADCEINYLKIAKSLDFYGVDRHPVTGEDGRPYEIGLTPRGILLIRDGQKQNLHLWPRITAIKFRRNFFKIRVQTRQDSNHEEKFKFILGTEKAAKHLWKSAIEHHSFFRLVKASEPAPAASSLMSFGSRFRYSGRTLYEASRDSSASSGRRSVKVNRAKSERYTQRTTAGYIRVGSRVWAKAENGDFYKGHVAGLRDRVYIKFDNGDTIAHEKTNAEAIVYDMDPNPAELCIGSRVIGYWPSVPAYLAGSVEKIENNRYFIKFDDGDRRWNNLEQIRLLKPPLYFGPGSNATYLQKRYSMLKTTSLMSTPSPPANSSMSAVGLLGLEEPTQSKPSTSTRAEVSLGEGQRLSAAIAKPPRPDLDGGGHGLQRSSTDLRQAVPSLDRNNSLNMGSPTRVDNAGAKIALNNLSTVPWTEKRNSVPDHGRAVMITDL